jgi:hypothetical protein
MRAHATRNGEDVLCCICRAQWIVPGVAAAAAAAAGGGGGGGFSMQRGHGYVNLASVSSAHAGVSAAQRENYFARRNWYGRY